MKNPASIVIMAALLLCATAHGTPDPVARALEHADANRDGKVTFDELRLIKPGLTAEQFRKLDRNNDNVLTEADLREPRPGGFRAIGADFDGDHKVTLEEARRLIPGLTEEMFQRMDANGDGVLSMDDRPVDVQDPWMRDRLRKADLNRDGKVSFDEARQRIPGMTRERFDRLDRNGDGYLTQEDARKNTGHGLFAARLHQADEDLDGKLSYEETSAQFPNMTREVFDRLDKDGDGYLTATDLLSALRPAE
jgi:Ca2+-binding EF-hand superfamily protein